MGREKCHATDDKKFPRLYISHCKTEDVPRKRQRKALPGDFPCERIMERRNKEAPLHGPFAIRYRDGVSDLSFVSAYALCRCALALAA